MNRSPRPDTSAPEHDAPARARRERRSTLPWTSVVAGAGIVVAAVSTAGFVGASTGGVHAVVVPTTLSEGGSLDDSDIPEVEPRPEHEVTRVPPVRPDDASTRGTTRPAQPSDDDPASDSASTDDPSRGESSGDDPSTGSPSGTTKGDPSPAPSDTTDPSAESDPSADPDTDATADPEDGAADAEAGVAWVQERLVAFGAELDQTGKLDDATVAALTAFQDAHGLVPTGTVTSETVQALAQDPEKGDVAPPSDGAGGDGDDGSGGEDTGSGPDDKPTTAETTAPTPAPTGSAPTQDAPHH